MGKRLRFTSADHARVAAAIREAEASTSGEIFAVFTRASHGYLAEASVAVLALSLLAGLLSALAAWFAELVVPALSLILAMIAGAGLLLGLLGLVPPLRLFLVPAAVKAKRADELAKAQFLAHNLHVTEARTGILLFVSEAEHHAEVVADVGIDAKVPQAEWDAIVGLLTDAARNDRLADGYVEAIGRAGRLLAVHFPASARSRNEIADRLVEL